MDSNNNKKTIFNLPNEIILIIFNFLSVKDWLNFVNVCKLFLKIVFSDLTKFKHAKCCIHKIIEYSKLSLIDASTFNINSKIIEQFISSKFSSNIYTISDIKQHNCKICGKQLKAIHFLDSNSINKYALYYCESISPFFFKNYNKFSNMCRIFIDKRDYSSDNSNNELKQSSDNDYENKPNNIDYFNSDDSDNDDSDNYDFDDDSDNYDFDDEFDEDGFNENLEQISNVMQISTEFQHTIYNFDNKTKTIYNTGKFGNVQHVEHPIDSD